MPYCNLVDKSVDNLTSHNKTTPILKSSIKKVLRSVQKYIIHYYIVYRYTFKIEISTTQAAALAQQCMLIYYSPSTKMIA